MCGFVGFSGTCANPEGVINQMLEKIVHRGPDSHESYVDPFVAMGFARLSIIDLAGGNQPMTNEDGSLVLVFNGEIYNFQELRDALMDAGHLFKTRCDSEVLLHGYEEYGPELLPKLRGMFAFTIWDRRKSGSSAQGITSASSPITTPRWGRPSFSEARLRASCPIRTLERSSMRSGFRTI